MQTPGQLTLALLWEPPHYPYATNDLAEGLYRHPRDQALTMRHIQHSHENLLNVFVVDVDTPDAALRAVSSKGSHPHPHWVAENPANGHAHVAWVLREPVTRTVYASRKATAYADAVAFGLRRALDGDRSYGGLLTKNPYSDAWRVETFPTEGYDLDQLAATLGPNMPPRGFRHRVQYQRTPDDLGRNCLVFETVRKRIYQPSFILPFLDSGDGVALGRAIYTECATRNAAFPANEHCPGPMRESEVRAIAASITRWVLRKSYLWKGGPDIYRARLSARQAARGRRSAAARQDTIASLKGML